ncbi:hypothetical protein Sjap_010665 [Stephania japonica]|uniref:F-box domain-containing protein n=1 Tax=Stephania japonica TaxID=461633 RepID=A0AAP0P4D2_9MAGN
MAEEANRDRLSDLPTHIIHHILSFIETGYPQLIVLPSLIELPNLKYLALHCTTLVGDHHNVSPTSSSEVVLSFPSLKTLSILDSLKNLVINAPKLKQFYIAQWPGGEDVLDRSAGEIKVLAPNLRVFYCDNCITRKFSFEDLSHLDQACFTITTDNFRYATSIMNDGLAAHRATRVLVQTCPRIKHALDPQQFWKMHRCGFAISSI